jgi:hypothetical protein
VRLSAKARTPSGARFQHSACTLDRDPVEQRQHPRQFARIDDLFARPRRPAQQEDRGETAFLHASGAAGDGQGIAAGGGHHVRDGAGGQAGQSPEQGREQSDLA